MKVGRFPFIGNGKAIALGEPEGMVKTVFDAKTGELLGAHMIGAEVTELIQGYTIAQDAGDHRGRADAHRLPAPDDLAKRCTRRCWTRTAGRCTSNSAPDPSPLPAGGEREMSVQPRESAPRPVYGEREGPIAERWEGEGQGPMLEDCR